MAHRDEDSSLGTWFWFFLAFPLALVVVLLWQRRRLQSQAASLPIVRRLSALRRPQYSEPDSIPIDLRAGPEAAVPEPVEQTEAPVLEQPEMQPATATGPDDLKIIEGIGPAISRLLQEQGILTFRQLAETPVERLDEILRAANLRRLANPDTWSEQAALAAAGNWIELDEFQATLKGGRRRGE